MEEAQLQENTKTTKQKVFFWLKVAGNAIFYIVIICLLLFSIMNIRSGKESFPNIFGRGFLAVVSDSMERSNDETKWPEEWKNYKVGGINKGDLIHADVFNGDIKSLKVGDVITFYDANLKALNSHRIVEINIDNKYVITQGDKAYESTVTRYEAGNQTKNYWLDSNGYIDTVVVSNIKGVATGVQAGAGNVLLNIQQNWLFYFVIPVGIILLVEIFFVFKNILDLKNEKNRQAIKDDKEAMKAELELEREKMRAEILAELKKETNDTNEEGKDATSEVEDPQEKTEE